MPPLRSFAAIEFPGVLRDPGDPSLALAALGGVQAVQNYLDALPSLPETQSGACLTLNLRPSNLVSQSNISADPHRKTTQLFLVRLPSSFGFENSEQNCRASHVDDDARLENVSTHAPNSSAGEEGCTATIVGRVTTFTEFRSLADFQYHPTTDAVRPYSTSHPSSSFQNASPYEESQHRTAVAERVYHCLLEKPARNLTLAQCIDRLRPQKIARPAPERGAANYWYRQYSYNGPDVQPHNPATDPPLAFIPGESLGFDGRSDPRRLQRLPHRISYSSDAVPHNAPLSSPTIFRGRAVFAKLVSLLKLLFEQRPIWLRRTLLLGIPAEFRPSFKPAIARVAYSFQGTGPFFQACVKYGYDPRKDPNSRKYQVLEVRCAHPLFEEVRQLREQQKDASNDIGDLAIPEQANIDEKDVGPSSVTLELFKMPSEFVLEGVPRKKNNFYQVCDLLLEPVKEFLRKQKRIKTYDSRSGFFTREALGKIIDEIKVTLLKEAVQFVGEERAKRVFRGDLTAESMLKKPKAGRLKLTDVMKSANMGTKGKPSERPEAQVAGESNTGVRALNKACSEGDSDNEGAVEDDDVDLGGMGNSLPNGLDDSGVDDDGGSIGENPGVEASDECFPTDENEFIGCENDDEEDEGEKEDTGVDLVPFEIYGSEANAVYETNKDGLYFGIDSDDEEGEGIE